MEKLSRLPLVRPFVERRASIARCRVLNARLDAKLRADFPGPDGAALASWLMRELAA